MTNTDQAQAELQGYFWTVHLQRSVLSPRLLRAAATQVARAATFGGHDVLVAITLSFFFPFAASSLGFCVGTPGVFDTSGYHGSAHFLAHPRIAAVVTARCSQYKKHAVITFHARLIPLKDYYLIFKKNSPSWQQILTKCKQRVAQSCLYWGCLQREREREREREMHGVFLMEIVFKNGEHRLDFSSIRSVQF